MGSFLINGLKLLLVQILYFLPVILLVILAFVLMISTLIAAGALSEDFSGISDSQTERWLSSHP
jgi:TRAP-type mannitol/chloroaromatic compound transport system permease small subunit